MTHYIQDIDAGQTICGTLVLATTDVTIDTSQATCMDCQRQIADYVHRHLEDDCGLTDGMAICSEKFLPKHLTDDIDDVSCPDCIALYKRNEAEAAKRQWQFKMPGEYARLAEKLMDDSYYESSDAQVEVNMKRAQVYATLANASALLCISRDITDIEQMRTAIALGKS